MAFVLDVLALLVIAFCIWRGWRRGFIKALSRLVSFVLALVIALLLSGPVSELVYDTAIAPGLRDALVEHMSDEALTSVEAQVDTAMGSIPDFLRNLLKNQGITNGADVLNKLEGNPETVEGLAWQIESTVIAPVVLALLRALVFFLLFLLASLLTSLLMRVLDRLFDLPLLRRINSTLGFIPGAINGLLWALALASVVQVLAATGTADSLLNPAVLADTSVIAWLAGINPLGDTLQELLITNA